MQTEMNQPGFRRSIGTWQVLVSGIALVVAASTLVSDFTGYFTLGGAFVLALLLAFVINLLLGMSAADLSVAYPRSGAIYDYARSIFRGLWGERLGVFLGLTFFGMFAFAASGETAAGAYGLKALVGSDLPLSVFIVLLMTLAVIPNLLGIRTAAWASAGLLLFMLGIRWYFGLMGFLGVGDTGPWSASNLDAGVGAGDWFGEGGILAAGLGLAFWSFVGIEFSCSLAEEVKSPRRAMPRGILLALGGILATSLFMGVGVVGTAPTATWQAAAAGALGNGGESPQLAVGHLMFGKSGYSLMALASVTAALGTLTVAFAAMPRILYSIARDGRFFGPLSETFGKLNPRFGTPIAATLLTLGLYLIPALYSSQVVDWLYSAAYVWTLLYVVFHVLAFANRILRPESNGAFPRSVVLVVGAAGVVLTLLALYYAFLGSHGAYGSRGLVVLAAALAATAASFRLRKSAHLTGTARDEKATATRYSPSPATDVQTASF